MKKRYLIVLIALLPFVLSGCVFESTGARLSRLANKTYAAIRLEVTASEEGRTLHGTYVTRAAQDGYTVSYTYERLATIEETDGGLVFPENEIAVKTGSMTVKGGEVVAREGDECDLPVGALTASGLRFNDRYFSTPQKEEDGTLVFSLPVGPDVLFKPYPPYIATGNRCEVKVTCRPDALERLGISYVYGDCAVTMAYTFTS